MTQNCPCQSHLPYSECCEPFITGKSIPQTPEQLMRSRYTAYTQARVDYIMATMQGKALRGFDMESARLWASRVQWLGLEVIKAPKPGPMRGYVEFMARYWDQG